MIALMSSTVLPWRLGQLSRCPLPRWERTHGAADPGNGWLQGSLPSPRTALRSRPAAWARAWPEQLLALLNGIGADHLADSVDSVVVEEHVLGTAQADTLSAQARGPSWRRAGVSALVRTCSLRYLSAQLHNAAELTGDGSVNGRDNAVVNVTGRTVDGDVVALVDRSCRPERTSCSPHPC